MRCDVVMPVMPVGVYCVCASQAMRQQLLFKEAPCWPAGTKCWNNGLRVCFSFCVLSVVNFSSLFSRRPGQLLARLLLEGILARLQGENRGNEPLVCGFRC